MRTLLHVYYGNDKRWDDSLLKRVQEALSRECIGFDGLQADFEYDNKDEALVALLVVRDLGVRAKTCGIGEGPTAAALGRARDAMRSAYKDIVGRK